MAQVLIVSCCLASCNYLDVIPPAQADFDDTMKDEETTLGFLYSCYAGVPRTNPFYLKSFEQATDEKVFPPEYVYWPQLVAWGTISPSSNNEDRANLNIWSASYNNIGYVHHFLSLIDELHPTGVTEDDKKTFQEFSFDNEGIRNAVDWLNRFYGENYGTDEEKADTEKRQL